MRVGTSVTIEAAHFLPGHPKCGNMHGHTYRFEVEVEGAIGGNGMVVELDELRARIEVVLSSYDHRVWNESLDMPTVENIAALVGERIARSVVLPTRLRVYEGERNWAEGDFRP